MNCHHKEMDFNTLFVCLHTLLSFVNLKRLRKRIYNALCSSLLIKVGPSIVLFTCNTDKLYVGEI